MSNLHIMVCPWQKTSEYSCQWDEARLKFHSIKNELFGTCYGARCPFYDNIAESCMARKTLTTMQR